MMKTKKCLQIFTLVLTMIFCIATVACVDNHEMTEQEQEIAAAAVRAYYEGLPEIMQDYITESSLKELSVCDPKDSLINIYGPGPGEHHHGMAKSYSLILNNGCELVLRYGVIKDGKLADHAVIYSSPEYPCSTMESAIEQIKNHRPSFEDDDWLNDILDNFYTTDSDIRAEWAYLYNEMVQEISENGIPQHQETDTLYKYRTTKITHITENGNYHFEFVVTYDAALTQCYYEYSVQLEAMKT